MEKKVLSLSLRIEYTTEGRDPDPDLTAAGLVIRPNFATIEEGVKVDRVETYKRDRWVDILDGGELVDILIRPDPDQTTEAGV